MQDIRRYVSIVFLTSVALLLWLFMKIFQAIFNFWPGVERPLFAGIHTSAALGFVAAVAVVALLWKNARVYQWVTDVVDQLVKVTWPTAEETRTSSITVVVFCVILGGILSVMDIVGKQLIDFVFTVFT